MNVAPIALTTLNNEAYDGDELPPLKAMIAVITV
jgi:hypothetical protein